MSGHGKDNQMDTTNAAEVSTSKSTDAIEEDSSDGTIAVEAGLLESMDSSINSALDICSCDRDSDSLVAARAQNRKSPPDSPEHTIDAIPLLSSGNSDSTNKEIEKNISSIADWLKKEFSKTSSASRTSTEPPFCRSYETSVKAPSSSGSTGKQTKQFLKPLGSSSTRLLRKSSETSNTTQDLKINIIKTTRRGGLPQASEKTLDNLNPSSTSNVLKQSPVNVATSSEQMISQGSHSASLILHTLSRQIEHSIDHLPKNSQFPESSKKSLNSDDENSSKTLDNAIEKNTVDSDSSCGSFDSNFGLRSNATSDSSTESNDVESPTEYSTRHKHPLEDSDGTTKAHYEHQTKFCYSPDELRVDLLSQQHGNFPKTVDAIVMSAAQSPKRLYFPDDSVGSSNSQYENRLRSRHSSEESREDFKSNYGHFHKNTGGSLRTYSRKHSSDSSISHNEHQTRSRHSSGETRVDSVSNYENSPKSSDIISHTAYSTKTHHSHGYSGDSHKNIFYERPPRFRLYSGESHAGFKSNYGNSLKTLDDELHTGYSHHSPFHSAGSSKSSYDHQPRTRHSSEGSINPNRKPRSRNFSGETEIKPKYVHSSKTSDYVSPTGYSTRSRHSPGNQGGSPKSQFDHKLRTRHSSADSSKPRWEPRSRHFSGESRFLFTSNPRTHHSSGHSSGISRSQYDHQLRCRHFSGDSRVGLNFYYGHSLASENLVSNPGSSVSTRHFPRDSGSFKSHWEHQPRSRNSPNDGSKSEWQSRSSHSSAESRFPKASQDVSHTGYPRTHHPKPNYDHRPRSRHSSGGSTVDFKPNYGHSPETSDNAASNTGCALKSRHPSRNSEGGYKIHYGHKPRSHYYSGESRVDFKSHAESLNTSERNFETSVGNSGKTEIKPKSQITDNAIVNNPDWSSSKHSEIREELVSKLLNKCKEFTKAQLPLDRISSNQWTSKGCADSYNIPSCSSNSAPASLIDGCVKIWDNNAESQSRELPNTLEKRVQSNNNDRKSKSRFASQVEVLPHTSEGDLLSPSEQPQKPAIHSKNIHTSKRLTKSERPNIPPSCTSSSNPASHINDSMKTSGSCSESQLKDVPNTPERSVYSNEKQRESRLRNRSASNTEVSPHISIGRDLSIQQPQNSENSNKNSQKSRRRTKSEKANVSSSCISGNNPASLIKHSVATPRNCSESQLTGLPIELERRVFSYRKQRELWLRSRCVSHAETLQKAASEENKLPLSNQPQEPATDSSDQSQETRRLHDFSEENVLTSCGLPTMSLDSTDTSQVLKVFDSNVSHDLQSTNDNASQIIPGIDNVHIPEITEDPQILNVHQIHFNEPIEVPLMDSKNILLESILEASYEGSERGGISNDSSADS